MALSGDDVRATAEAHGITGRYVLADGLKNPAVILRARRSACRPRCRRALTLVFFARHAARCCRCCRRPWPAARPGSWSGRQPRRAGGALRRSGEAFAFPSWIEGFGIPLLEAMTYGAPIIASDRGAIPEVAGDAGLLADAEDDVALAAHLRRVLGSEAERNRLRQQGWERAAQFSWRGTALSILDSYRQACASSTAIATAG